MNLMMLLEMAAQGFGDRVAVQSGEERLSYGELFGAAGGAAARIRESGLERVAFLDVSSVAVPVALFASAWSGKPFVPLNYRLTQVELEGLASQIAPALLVTSPDRVEPLQKLSGITRSVHARRVTLRRHTALSSLWQ